MKVEKRGRQGRVKCSERGRSNIKEEAEEGGRGEERREKGEQ